MQTTGTTNGILNRCALTLGSALILLFYSELFFVNEGPVFDAIAYFSAPSSLLAFAAELIFWYVVFALWLLIPIALFNVRSIWALFLAACLCGWAIEGLIIPEMYINMPLSIFWPSVGWHVFIDIFIGWWFMQKLLQKNNYLLTTAVSIGLGLFWGIWATWFWGNGEATLITPMAFAIMTVGATSLLIIGYWLVDRFGGTDFRPTRIEMIMAILLSLGVWGIATISITPLQFIFPVLTAVVVAALVRNNGVEKRSNILTTFNGRTELTNLGLLMLIPIAASLSYPFYFEHQIGFSESWILLLPLIAAGVVMMFLSFFKIITARC